MIQNDKGSTNQKGNPYLQGFNMTRSDYKLGYEIDRDHSNNPFLQKVIRSRRLLNELIIMKKKRKYNAEINDRDRKNEG